MRSPSNRLASFAAIAFLALLPTLDGCPASSNLDASKGTNVAPSAPPVASTPPEIAAPPAPPPPPPAPPPLELPLGGRTIFPAHRLIGYCGTPGAPALGQLQGNLTSKAKALKTYAEKYPSDRKPLLVFELIVVIAQAWQGSDGKYRRRIENSVVDDYLKVARQSKALLLLNIQPGQSDFMTEIKRYETYLKEPDVGIALDPEWAVKAKQKPGVFFGQTTGATINEIAAYMAGIIKENDLPEKALVFHQLNRFVVKDESVIVPQPGVVLIKSVDGLGPQHAKRVTYDDLMKTIASGVHPGFKLFLDEDSHIGKVMVPSEVMSLVPKPEYVMVE